MSKYVGAIDQGTTSSRFILFDKDGTVAHVDQREHEQINPKAGWVEHDANELWRRTRQVINGAMADSDAEAGDIEAIGITNQRETTVVWDRETGEPIHNAIVWQDTRRAGSSTSSPATRASTGCARSPGCRSPRTSPGRRSRGCSTMSRGPASARRRAGSPSGPRTRGCPGT